MPGQVLSVMPTMPARQSIALVMPNHNHANFLEQSIGGMLRQSRPADEIIIIDDASSDNSCDVISHCIQGQANVRFIRNDQQLGALATLNKGLMATKCDFVAFPSADDLLMDEFLQDVGGLLEQYPDAAFASARVRIETKDGKSLGTRPLFLPTLTSTYTSAGETRSLLEQGDNFFLGPVTIYRRSTLLALGGFDSELGSVSDGFVQRQLALRHGFCFLPKITGVWRIHDSNYSITSVTDPAHLEKLLVATKAAIEREPPEIFPADYASLFERRLRFGAARIVAAQQKPWPEKSDTIALILHSEASEQRLLGRLGKIGPLSEVFTIAWLLLRLRPFSFARLAVEPFRRFLVH
jgi:glycosyltransferase involved in cell wall biosynthesis